MKIREKIVFSLVGVIFLLFGLFLTITFTSKSYIMWPFVAIGIYLCSQWKNLGLIISFGLLSLAFCLQYFFNHNFFWILGLDVTFALSFFILANSLNLIREDYESLFSSQEEKEKEHEKAALDKSSQIKELDEEISLLNLEKTKLEQTLSIKLGENKNLQNEVDTAHLKANEKNKELLKLLMEKEKQIKLIDREKEDNKVFLEKKLLELKRLRELYFQLKKSNDTSKELLYKARKENFSIEEKLLNFNKKLEEKEMEGKEETIRDLLKTEQELEMVEEENRELYAIISKLS